MTDESGYIDYFSILEVEPGSKPAEVIKNYRKKAKRLVIEISEAEMTEEKRNRYLLQLAQLNAAYYILRDRTRSAQYERSLEEVIRLETEWRERAGDPASSDQLRRRFDQALRNFLAVYMEEAQLEAGRDPECVEYTGWDAAHERHASRVLRHYRQQRYHEIQERLPYFEVTAPMVDWDERRAVVSRLLEEQA